MLPFISAFLIVLSAYGSDLFLVSTPGASLQLTTSGKPVFSLPLGALVYANAAECRSKNRCKVRSLSVGSTAEGTVAASALLNFREQHCDEAVQAILDRYNGKTTCQQGEWTERLDFAEQNLLRGPPARLAGALHVERWRALLAIAALEGTPASSDHDLSASCVNNCGVPISTTWWAVHANAFTINELGGTPILELDLLAKTAATYRGTQTGEALRWLHATAGRATEGWTVLPVEEAVYAQEYPNGTHMGELLYRWADRLCGVCTRVDSQPDQDAVAQLTRLDAVLNSLPPAMARLTSVRKCRARCGETLSGR